jgi:hypothetical protein
VGDKAHVPELLDLVALHLPSLINVTRP